MLGRVIDMNITEAFIELQDNKTIDIGMSHLPHDCKIGDMINFDPNFMEMKNDRLL